jgi:hypothetical protein
MLWSINKLSFTNCLDKQFNHSFRLFCVYQFRHLVYPFATSNFRRLSSLLRVHPSLCWFMKAYYSLRVLRLLILPLCPSYVLARLQTILPWGIFNQYRFSIAANRLRSCNSGSFMRLSVSPVGFIPDAANTSGNFFTNVSSVETIMCIVSFYIGNNYRDLIAASLYCRLLQTHLLHPCLPEPTGRVHHLPHCGDAACNRFDGEGCLLLPPRGLLSSHRQLNWTHTLHLQNTGGTLKCDLQRSGSDSFIRETVRKTYSSTSSSLPVLRLE